MKTVFKHTPATTAVLSAILLVSTTTFAVTSAEAAQPPNSVVETVVLRGGTALTWKKSLRIPAMKLSVT